MGSKTTDGGLFRRETWCEKGQGSQCKAEDAGTKVDGRWPVEKVEVWKQNGLRSLWFECDLEKGPSVRKEHGREATASKGESGAVFESENGLSGSGL